MPVRAPVDLSDFPVVDGHCHPLLADPWALSPETFLALFSEGRPGSMTAHIAHTSYYRRALDGLARRLGAEPAVEAVLERRQKLGPDGVRGWLSESRLAALLVDTGYPPDAMPLSEMRHLLPCAVHEIFRIESCAQTLLARGLEYEAFLQAFREALRGAARHAVAFKSIIAYRSGLAIRPWTTGEAELAYRRELARLHDTGSSRLTEKPLLDTLLGVALDVANETGRPLQVHAGFGDPDLDLPQANPALLRSVLEDPRWNRTRIVVLHLAYPYFREAAALAAVWPQVHVDLSLALPFLGPGAVAPLIETLSLAPTSKLLYGSDLGGLPELYGLSAEWGRRALGEALGWLVEREGLAREQARVIGRQILWENAVTLYDLRAPISG